MLHQLEQALRLKHPLLTVISMVLYLGVSEHRGSNLNRFQALAPIQLSKAWGLYYTNRGCMWGSP